MNKAFVNKWSYPQILCIFLQYSYKDINLFLLIDWEIVYDAWNNFSDNSENKKR